jgi:soluble lytic murein transglycosylase
MQMIPEKAKVLSIKYNIPYQTVDDLYLPNINIEMGTALLSELLKNYKFKFVQSTASYNASSTAIAKWEKDRFHGNYIEFIEQIPYEETRNYIKLVFRNYIAYKRILSDKPIEIDSNFFAHSFLNPEAL